jgi:hypothetical protein
MKTTVAFAVLLVAGCRLGHPGAHAGARTMVASHRDTRTLTSVEAGFVLNYPDDDGEGGLYNPSTIEADSDGGILIGGGIGYESSLRGLGPKQALLLGGSGHLAIDIVDSDDDHTGWVGTFEMHVALSGAISSTRIGPMLRVYDRREANSWCAGLQLQLMLADRTPFSPGDPIADFFGW